MVRCMAMSSVHVWLSKLLYLWALSLESNSLSTGCWLYTFIYSEYTSQQQKATMKRFRTRSTMYLRWITFLTVIELLKTWKPSPMALTIHWWPFYPYTIPDTSHKQIVDNNAVRGFLYDILLQTLQTCYPDLENQKFQMTRYSTQQDFLHLLMNQTEPITEFYLPTTIQDKSDHIHKEGLRHRLPPDSTFLPVLECPGEKMYQNVYSSFPVIHKFNIVTI